MENFIKCIIFTYCFKYINTHHQIKGNLTVMKVPLRPNSTCPASENCVSKCCPLNFVFFRKKNTVGCTSTGFNTDNFLHLEYPIYNQKYFLYKANLTNTFNVMVGVTCRRKYKLHNPFFIQKVG